MHIHAKNQYHLSAVANLISCTIEDAVCSCCTDIQIVHCSEICRHVYQYHLAYCYPNEWSVALDRV